MIKKKIVSEKLIKKGVIREILIFLIVFWMVSAIILFGLSLKRKPFRQDIYEQMVSNVSAKRNLTDDPCLYSIFGDPETKRYLKIQLICPNGKSISSFDYDVLKTDTIEEVINTMAKIGNFMVTFMNGQIRQMGNLGLNKGVWQCTNSGKPIKNVSEKVDPGAMINCEFKSK